MTHAEIWLLALLIVCALLATIVACLEYCFREMARRDVAERAERNMLLERVQRPDVPILTVEPVAPAAVKLWRSEDDEIQADRDPEVARALQRIDELVHEKGEL